MEIHFAISSNHLTLVNMKLLMDNRQIQLDLNILNKLVASCTITRLTALVSFLKKF